MAGLWQYRAAIAFITAGLLVGTFGGLTGSRVLGLLDRASSADTAVSRPGGWPGPANTGVPPGTTLTAYTGPCTITRDGTVIDGKTVGCSLGIEAAGVTIRNSKVNGTVRLDTDHAGADRWSMTITDTEVDAGTQQLAAICCGNMTVARTNAHGGVTAMQCEEKSVTCVIRDSWLHGQYLPADQPWHLGGFLSDGTRGRANCTDHMCISLVHNHIVCDHPQNALQEGCTGDVNLLPHFGPISGVLVQGNLLGANADLAYCTFAGTTGAEFPRADHVVYRDNVFQRGPNRKCGAYGPVTDFNQNHDPDSVWANNKYEDGTPVPPA